MLGLFKRCSGKHFSAPAKRLLYLALVRSHLDYASEAWSGQSIEVIRSVEGVQRRATNYILGYSNALSYKDRLIESNLLPVCYWHEMKDFIFLHGCINGTYNVNLNNYLRFTSSTRLRNSCDFNFNVPKSKTKHFESSFFIRTCRLWNNLPIDVKAITSSNAFKSSLKNRYFSSLNHIFDVDVIRTWRSICLKCNSLINLATNDFKNCC